MSWLETYWFEVAFVGLLSLMTFALYVLKWIKKEKDHGDN